MTYPQPTTLELITAYGGDFLIPAGDSVIGNTLKHSGEFETKDIKRALDYIDNMNHTASKRLLFIDIGANIGTHCISALKEHGFDKAIAVEPSLSNYRLLTANLCLNGLMDRTSCTLAAASNKDGCKTLFHNQSNCGDYRLDNSPDSAQSIESSEAEQVRTIDILSYLSQLSVHNKLENSLCWIDTQGHEIPILQSLKSLLEGGLTAVFEFWPYGMEQQKGKFELLASALRSPSLQIAHFDKDKIEPISLQQLELLWNELRALDTGKPEGASFSNILVYPNKASASILSYSNFYSQNFEDVLLARCFSDVNKGFYIDVGAQDHEADSVTLYFYERGWSGINIEPVAELAESFKCRDRDTTICCAAGSDDMIMPMTISLDSGLSSLKPKNSSKSNLPRIDLTQRNIRVRRLDSILEDLGISGKTFEFLKIDVEGHEVEVLKGINLTHYRPQVILCEVTEPNSLIITNTFSDICIIVESQGYKKLYFDGLNQWWCLSERFDVLAEHFNRPPGVFDSILISPYAGSSARKKVVELSESLEAATQKLDCANQKLHAMAQNLDEVYASRGWKLIENMRKTWRSIRH